jgi:PhoH-like ATPase
MAPWMMPIIQNLAMLEPKKVTAPKKGYDDSNIAILEKNEIFIQSLDYIRGATYNNAIIIIDEAQNLSPHQIKTIITRAGKGTKLIFTGDLSQIDNQSLDKDSSGLAYAINRLAGEEYIGVVNFTDVVRSRLARLAEKKL